MIDQQLAKAGWNVNDPTQVVQEFDIIVDLPEGVAEAQTPYQGHQFSDYVLLDILIEKRNLIQSPFTVIHPQEIRGVFSPAQINDILKLTETLAA